MNRTKEENEPEQDPTRLSNTGLKTPLNYFMLFGSVVGWEAVYHHSNIQYVYKNQQVEQLALLMGCPAMCIYI